jgi:hypothetical protein
MKKSTYLSSLFLFISLFSQSLSAKMPIWSYDAGPNPKTKMGKELIDILANMPDMPELSEKVMGEQKFRPAFGPVTWRMLQGKNKTKILFIGQDATHIAEAAGRPATAGFGGRAQDLAAYFGVNEGAAFINTYAYTIKGQYGAFQTPYVLKSREATEIKLSNFVDNELWLLTQDLDSPIVQWRNSLIDWIIRNNKESIKLIVTFGGAARDSIASFIRGHGGEVKASRQKIINRVQVAETKLMYAGGNNEYPALMNARGQDLYEEILGTQVDYSSPDDQALIQKTLIEKQDEFLEKMVFTKGGFLKNGMIHPAQLGGFDLNQITIHNEVTRNLRGLELSDGSEIENDVLVVELPHPTFLSNMDNTEASQAVAEDLKVLKPYVDAGWEIPADPEMENRFALGQSYKYARADIGPEYYDFGTPGTRMVPVSSASRMGGNPHVIIFGTRERAKFDMDQINNMTYARPNENFSNSELFITRPRTTELRYTFDPGPGEEFAKIMKENLDMKKIFKTKENKSFKEDGIDAFYVKNHPDIGDFGHYRGTFTHPEIIVIADPMGFDDLMTARALTGERGQYLQGLMNDLGVNDQYLVIKTTPFGMDKATHEDWKYVLEQTQNYREKLMEKILNENTPKLIVTDGKYAEISMNKYFENYDIPVINLKRSTDHSADMKALAETIKEMKIFSRFTALGKMSNIPRSHLSFYARTWEGTSGDRVINSTDQFRGLGFAMVAPKWAFDQKIKAAEDTSKEFDDGSKLLIQKLEINNLPLPGEEIPEFLRRKEIDPTLGFVEAILKTFAFVA